MTKRLVALSLVLLLSIESFGAVVSDNDGSAFITKAEFDSLKNNFQSQIDQYNTSIDSKIDGAIASYLAGIVQARTFEIINNQWTNWIMLNKILQNDYHMPTLHAMIDLSSHYHLSVPDFGWRTLDKFVHANGNLSYTNSSNDNKKNVAEVTLDNVGNLDNTKIFWKGRALNCKEIYSLNSIVKNDNFGWAYLGYYDSTAYSNKLFVSAPCTFKKTGYVKPYLNNSSDPFWNPNIRFFYSDNGKSWTGKNNLDASSTFQSCALTLEYNVNDFGVAWDYEHIGCYRKNDELELNGFNINSIINFSNNQTKNSKNILDSATKYGKYDGVETDYQNGTSGVDYSGTLKTYNHVWGKTLEWYDTDDPTASSIVYKEVKLPTIGLIGNKKAYEIYQFDPVGIGDGTLPKVSLNAGYLAFNAVADVDIDWTVYFNSITSSSLSIPSTTEIGIALALEPFDDEINVVNPNRIIYFDNNKTIKYAKTTNKKARLNFSVPDSGYVYMKFFPYILNADGSINWSLINSEEWEISFNPNLSKQYYVS